MDDVVGRGVARVGRDWSVTTNSVGARASLFCSMLLSAAFAVQLSLCSAFAADGAPAATGVAGGTPYEFISGTVQFFLMAFFVYFLLVLRPQQLKEDDQARFLKELKKDDEVLTSGGLFGRVAMISDQFVTVEVANGVKVRVHPQHISPAVTGAAGAQRGASQGSSNGPKGPVKIK